MEVTQSLRRAVQQRPGAVMTICGDRRRTVRESAGRVARLASALHRLGVSPGGRVAILALNSDRFHELLYAVAWAGGVSVPLNTRWSESEIGYALRESGTRLLVADDDFTAMLPGLRSRWPGPHTVVHCGDGRPPAGTVSYEGLVAGAEPAADAGRGGNDLFAIFYTGGTTGLPRGVMLSHDNLLTSALGSLATGDFVSSGGRLLHVAPMFHLAEAAAWIAGCLVGSTHVFLPQFEPVRVLSTLRAAAITDILLVPTMIQMLVDHPACSAGELTGVQRVVYGASPIPEAVLRRARRVFPRAGFTQAYGMTELGPVATILLPHEHDDPRLLASGGRAAPHAEVRIAADDGSELPRGTVGEIVVRGDNVMLGYWNMPAETATALRGGWLHTGDAGYMDGNGYVFVVDRIKDMIITGGENVYSVEVEKVIAEHAAVAACAVIGLPDPDWGERVHAVVVAREGATLGLEELRGFCRKKIAGYKHPRSLTITGSLPLSSSGKVLKRELRASLTGQPAP
jgi:acyl-CoA synthetase (AMP-forming)/AMP-acid ligase II